MSGWREQSDPRNEYPAAGPRRAEENAMQVLAWRPDAELERTRGLIQLSYDGERGIVVLVTAEAFEIRLATVAWTGGAYGPAASSRLWRRIRAGATADETLPQLLDKALQARQAEFKRCRYCGESFPPEHRHGMVCHGCAERHLGIVH